MNDTGALTARRTRIRERAENQTEAKVHVAWWQSPSSEGIEMLEARWCRQRNKKQKAGENKQESLKTGFWQKE